MNIRVSLRLLVPLAVIGLFSGCASNNPMSRIDSNRSRYESFPVEMRQAILDQRVVNGMTEEMVEMAIGKPSEVQTRAGRSGAVEEIWIYGGSSSSGGGPLKNASVGIGVGPVYVSGIRAGGGRSDAEYREVVFQNGQVVSGGDPQ